MRGSNTSFRAASFLAAAFLAVVPLAGAAEPASADPFALYRDGVAAHDAALLKRAALAGHAPAMTALAFVLGGSDPAEARRWLEKAALRGHVDAELGLAAAKTAPGAIPASADEAERRLFAAIATGDLDAARAGCRVAAATLRGRFFRACMASAGAGDATAQYVLATVLDHRPDDIPSASVTEDIRKSAGLKAEPRRSLVWYGEAAKGGHAGAAARLALYAASGWNRMPDAAEALRLARQSAEADHPDGLAVLGLLTVGGRGVPADEAAGAALLLRGAQRGSALAMLSLAHAHLHGAGVPRDARQAAIWLNLIRFTSGMPPADRLGDVAFAPPDATTAEIAAVLSPAEALDARVRAAELRHTLAEQGVWPAGGAG